MAGAFRPMSAPVAAPFRGVFEAQALRSIPPEEPEERLTVAEVDRLLREREAVVEARVRAELEPRLHELRAALPVLEGALLAVERHRADVLRRAASDVADLALHIARRVVGDAVSDRPDAMHALLTEAIGKLDVSDVARIRVPPDQADAIRARMSPQLAERVVPDVSCQGQCVVEADGARAVVSFDEVFAALEAEVRAWADEGENWAA
jgi:hypothetical protein